MALVCLVWDSSRASHVEVIMLQALWCQIASNKPKHWAHPHAHTPTHTRTPAHTKDLAGFRLLRAGLRPPGSRSAAHSQVPLGRILPSKLGAGFRDLGTCGFRYLGI